MNGMNSVKWAVAMKLVEWGGRLAADEFKGQITAESLRKVADRMEEEIDMTVNESDGEVTVTATVDTNGQ